MEEAGESAEVVEIEVIPWLTDLLESRSSGRVRWREQIRAGETVRGLLLRLHESQPRLAAAVYDRDEARFAGRAHIIVNNRSLELAGGPDARLRDGDQLTLIPAYVGGQRVRCYGKR